MLALFGLFFGLWYYDDNYDCEDADNEDDDGEGKDKNDEDADEDDAGEDGQNLKCWGAGDRVLVVEITPNLENQSPL